MTPSPLGIAGIQPISPVNATNPVAGYSPLDLIALLQAQIAQNSITYQQLFAADAVAGIEQGWRIVFRWLAVDVASGQWGTPNWGDPEANPPVPAPYGDLSSEAGTTNLQEVTRFMALSHVVPNGMYEVQFQLAGLWYSAASLLQGVPMVAVSKGLTQPILYEPGPSIMMFSPAVYAQQISVPSAPAANTSNPVGSPVPGYPGGFHNVGGQAFSTPGMPDPSGQYTLQTPSPMQTNPAAMVWKSNPVAGRSA